MAQYRVPQSIFLPDRVIGPFTLGQFLYLFVAGAIDLGAYYTLPFALFVLLALVVSGLGLTFAFLKINDQPFNKFLISGLAFYFRPKQRIWQKLGEEEISIVKAPAPKKVAPQVRPATAEIKSKLRKLSQMLDTQGWQSLKEKRPEIANTATVDVPGGIPKDAKPIVMPVPKEVTKLSEIAGFTFAPQDKISIPAEIIAPISEHVPAEKEVMPLAPGIKVPSGSAIPPASAPLETEAPVGSPSAFIPPGT